MEKNLAGNYGSFFARSIARRDDRYNHEDAGDEPPHSPMEESTESDAKLDTISESESQPPPDEGGEDNAEEGSENKEEAAVEDVIDDPLLSLEKAHEDMDQFLATMKEKEEASVEIPVFLEKFLDLVEDKIARYDAGDERAKDDSSLLEAMSRISSLMKNLETQNQPEPLINRIGSIHQRAMAYLEEDFRLLMEQYRNATESDPGGHDHKGKHVEEQPQEDSENPPEESEPDFPGYSEETIGSLKEIAGEMFAGGYQSECCQVYITARRNAFDDAMQKLGFEKFSIDEVQKAHWETLSREMIPSWINTFKQCATVYFPGERRLVDEVFANQPELAAGMFSNLCRGAVIQLLNFSEGTAMTKRAAEKLFKLLDMYETVRDVIPKMDELFSEDHVAEELKTELNLAKSRLGEATISIFGDFENNIKSDTGKTPVPGGAVHPVTRYVMNYLNTSGDYKETLEQVFKEHSKIERADSTSRPPIAGRENRGQNGKEDEKEASSPFTAQVMRVMDLLDSYLDSKAKLYKDPSLTAFFLMNNGRYILQKIKGSSEMVQVMGDNWCRKRSSDLRLFHKDYLRDTWNNRVLKTALNHEGLTQNGKVHKPTLKERFKTFNAMFDEIHKTQSSWVVKDEQLQSELRISICAVVVPAYRAFLAKYSPVLDPGRQTEKYIKYQPEDLETYIDELFDGKPHQSIAKRKT
ncbi:hypothetical protein PIB30_066899 [Stylosanthes scabra]|uniref:Exocyst subunit Exo70 family protein n=1 Tax=Stylosanthes scabra TaxID=79078 RepID=A0ABU6YJZ9_9FABA|nr:hypothetical protein [Stylosanthes scabra]